MANPFLGWSKKKGKKTGYFHLQEIDGRWWMVDPEGNVFLSLGINHVRPRWLMWEYNRAYWEPKYGPVGDPFNVEKFKETKAFEVWKRQVRDDFLDWGFNTLGALSDVDLRPPDLPYTMMLWWVFLYHSSPVGSLQFPDVFSSDFEKRCDEIARKKCQPLAKDPLLVGYFYIEGAIITKEQADEKYGDLYWGMKHGKLATWTDAIKSFRCYEDVAPGKQVYVDLMKERYGDIKAFNRMYQTNCDSFRALLPRDMSAVVAIDAKRATEDDEAFLSLIMKQYYKVTTEAVRRYDPNHMVFGDRINGHGHDYIPDVVLEAMKPYVDTFSLHRYGYFDEIKDDLDRWQKVSEKPVFLVDPGFSVADENIPNPFGPIVESQEARARAFEDYARKAFLLPYVIGMHWCGYVDVRSAGQGPRSYTGIKDEREKPYKPLVEAMKRFNSQVYEYVSDHIRA